VHGREVDRGGDRLIALDVHPVPQQHELVAAGEGRWLSTKASRGLHRRVGTIRGGCPGAQSAASA
jgi:hypothetical protein